MLRSSSRIGSYSPKQQVKQKTAAEEVEMVIQSINPVIRGWGNYFKGGTVKRSFGELDGYIRGR